MRPTGARDKLRPQRLRFQSAEFLCCHRKQGRKALSHIEPFNNGFINSYREFARDRTSGIGELRSWAQSLLVTGDAWRRDALDPFYELVDTPRVMGG